ncbi:SDR family oxidoreductase, partial [Enhygromyxa salina]|uniref:SDR family oxidoreductase n=1 Tax=Enhygromyxa salina TaxID=215803 RepID=UPI0011BAD4E7
ELRDGALVAQLAAMVADELGVAAEEVGARTPLGELGMSSVGFTALSAALRARYAVEIYPTVFYRHTTLAALTDHLWAEHRAALEAHFGARDRVPVAAVGAPVEAGASAGEAGEGARAAGDDDIAIVGMAGRLPGSEDLDDFWRQLVAGADLVTEIPAERWDWREVAGSRSRWGGFVPDVARFDAAFFGISPREAELMDPQQRFMLELTWAALEDAGYDPRALAGQRVGVFFAVTNSDYLEVQRRHGRGPEGHTLTGAALSIIPNRVSYVLDLRGPSVAVDTACSGSLTAVHQASAALREGSCDIALAGGVSLILSPTIYEALSRGEMLSPDGRCRAFDSRANGYVRGEGAGVVVLERAERAARVGSPVHALIKAVAISHGGRTSSLTAPNPDAQTDLLVHAYREAGVPVETVGYIEAHGTGTALGDPIETMGLSEAFRRLEVERSEGAGACVIGSVKSNIGHLEAAAGIAGLFKAVLAMRHATIPASLHIETPNPMLELDAGFELADSTREWPAPRDREGRELARRAGVSSFGFGGANAHVVLEQAPHRPTPQRSGRAELVVLSARTPEALRETAARLLAHLDACADEAAPSLADLAHTLQSGRDAMRHRLALVVDDLAGLGAELRAHLDGRPSRVRVGEVEGQREGPQAGDEDLADAWVRGGSVDWRTIHNGAARRRVHLPSYPFARTRHWVRGESLAPARASGPRLHPTLLDANVSSFREHAFRKTLTRREFYLRDHLVAGRLVLPGVVYLEMARLAGELAAASEVRVVEDLVWATPVSLDDDEAAELELTVGLTKTADGARFEVRSEVGVHANGELRFAATTPRPAPVDLEAVRARCPKVYDGASCYEAFTRLGFAYGPSLRALERYTEGQGEALASLRLPRSSAAEVGDYTFHPALFDAALQAAGRLAPGASTGSGELVFMPFSLGAVRRYAPLPDQVHAHVRVASTGASKGVLAFDVALLDSEGGVCASIERFTLRAIPSGVHAFERGWAPAPADPRAALLEGAALVLDAGSEGDALVAALRELGLDARRVALGPKLELEPLLASLPAGPVHIVHLAGDHPDTRAAVDQGLHAAMALVQAWQRERRGPLRYLYAYRELAASPASPAMAAFGRCVHLEHPEIDFGVVAVAEAGFVEAVVAQLKAPPEVELRVGRGGRTRRSWAQVELPQVEASIFARAGAHLISGGTGALGLLLAEHIAGVRRAQGGSERGGERGGEGGIVLIARRQPSARARARAAAIGAEIVQADVSDAAAVHALVADARRRHGQICGVLHAAGELRDGLLVRKSAADVEAVLAAKVQGTVHLDEATRDDALDYFAMFSSAAAAFGNVGQSDYAFANAFMDAFAVQRELLRRAGARRGRNLAAAWPVWAEGGMRIDSRAEAYMERVLGMRPVPTRAGLDALERALAGDAPHL